MENYEIVYNEVQWDYLNNTLAYEFTRTHIRAYALAYERYAHTAKRHRDRHTRRERESETQIRTCSIDKL